MKNFAVALAAIVFPAASSIGFGVLSRIKFSQIIPSGHGTWEKNYLESEPFKAKTSNGYCLISDHNRPISKLNTVSREHG
ncbi:hypothetical protein V6N12_002556 [Hibiscus sabdariffa]|uniref:Uncharacterized protein n=1 Tax=Hibiscus sabdariffa TaxID=183260 RepID=A0ABR1Z6U4_9ROSI